MFLRSSVLRPLLPLLASLACLAGCASSPAPTARLAPGKDLRYVLRPGTGPVVIFQSGLGDGHAVWAPVMDKLPATMPALAYDRPGNGGSPSTADARDPCAIADELHQLVRQLDLKPPFVLVGHSLGGLYQHCYADRYPEEVLGLVLIDPTHPDHLAEMKRQAPSQAALLNVLRYSLFTAAMRQEFDDQAVCSQPLPGSPGSAKPTAFLFSGKFRLEERGAFEAMVRQLRRQWLSASPHAEARDFVNAGHYLQKEDPDAVVDAVKRIASIGDRTPAPPLNDQNARGGAL